MRAGNGKSVEAQGAGQGPRPAGGIYALNQGGQTAAGLVGLAIQNRPELFLQRHRSLVAGKRKGAFF